MTGADRAAASLRLLVWGTLLAGLGACTWWPAAGSGGMAELRRPDRPRCTGCLRPPDPTWQDLDTQRQLAAGHLETLVLRGADWCLPAEVALARELGNRILRELYGGLPMDAADDLIVARVHLAELERRLNLIQGQGACVRPIDPVRASARTDAVGTPPP